MTIEESGVQNTFEFQQENTTAKLNQLLLKYGLTPNQAKVYLFLSKIGTKTASETSKSLKIPRTETYHLLNSLQQKGILFSVFGKPTKFKASSIDKAISILIGNEKNRIDELEENKTKIMRLWNKMPEHVGVDEVEEDNRFQTLQGRNSILYKLNGMIKNSTEEILVLGTEADFIKFYHTDFTEYLKKTKSSLKILTTYSKKGNYIFEDVPVEFIKKLEDANRDNFCFIIKDDSEVTFFVNNPQLEEMIAIWTDSKSFVSTLKSLFSLIWKKSHFVHESNAESILGSDITYEHRLKEIEQEKLIINHMRKYFKLSAETRNK